MEITDNIVFVIHLIVGLVLVYFAIRAFKRTKYIPMVLLAIGFILLVVGETIPGYIFPNLENDIYGKYFDDAFEIAGFLVLIWAVKKS